LKITCLFGSKTDEAHANELVSGLKQKGHHPHLLYLSAHRNHEELDQYMESAEDSVDLYIAGAGLAAHLPGVVSSKTAIPVIGLPLGGAFCGLDAFMSIAQMPGGFPVVSSGVGNVNAIIKLTQKIEQLQNNDQPVLNIISSKNESSPQKKLIDKTVELAQKLDLSYKLSHIYQSECFNLSFTDLSGKEKAYESDLCIPYLEQCREQTALDGLKFLEIAGESGMYVGINNIKNAISFFASINKTIRNGRSVQLGDLKKGRRP
jgi:5-(carboxyamino)imidazole ribonucleotide mutase